MANPEQVIRGVQFNTSFDISNIDIDNQLGFLTVASPTDSSRRNLLGFGSAFDRNGGFVEGDITDPILDLDDLPLQYRNIDLQGKGVGPRMYNSPQAALGFTQLPRTIGAYVFTIDPDKIKDLRTVEGPKAQRIGRHALRIVRTKLQGLDGVVDAIHAGYGNSEAVLMTQPPRAVLRQKEFDEPKPGIPEELIIIRSALTLKRVGSKTYRRR